LQSTTHVPQANMHLIVETRHIGISTLHAHDFTWHTCITKFRVLLRNHIRDNSFNISGFWGTCIC
jgi:hypothetical protein